MIESCRLVLNWRLKFLVILLVSCNDSALFHGFHITYGQSK